jgi:tRNA modification GTPase
MAYYTSIGTDLNSITIAALATARAKAGIGIIRISGTKVVSIFEKLCPGQKVPRPKEATLARFLNAEGLILDHGIALYFPAPASFTGEDVLELQCHGNPVLLDILLARLLELGATLALPGEFSYRAFINGKMNLVQAEAVADLIEAQTFKSIQLAQRSLQGAFSQRINELVTRLIHIRVEVEAGLDFPDEELELLSIERLRRLLQELVFEHENLLQNTHYGCVLQEGIHIVISGHPNVGKSTLLNQLSQKDAAIVTEVPGTTRDLLRETINIEGFPVHLIDTAGLRNTEDPVEQEGIRRAKDAAARADILLLITDSENQYSDEILNQLPSNLPCLRVENKIDLSDQSYGKSNINNSIRISAKFGYGIDVLKKEILQLMGVSDNEQGEYLARRRHLTALKSSKEFLQHALVIGANVEHMELVAEELHQAQLALNSITGEFTNEDLLGSIFSSFCVGK